MRGVILRPVGAHIPVIVGLERLVTGSVLAPCDAGRANEERRR